VEKLNNLIKIFSEASDNPEEFKSAFENAIDRRVLKRRAALEEKRKLLFENIRVYILDGNEIHLRKACPERSETPLRNGEIWIAEHFNIDVSAQGDSIVNALEALFDSSVRYATALWELGREALAEDRLHHYDFIKSCGNAPKWEKLFKKALSDKLGELAQSALPETKRQAPVTTRVSHHIESLFLTFINTPPLLEPVFNTKTFDVNQLREFYNENFIPLNLGQVHVTILPDNDQIILHFIDSVQLDGLDVTIYRLSDATQESKAKQAITRQIRGNDVRFALSSLGLTIYDLDKVAFQLKVEDGYVEGRL
jgi:hypothetical protein